MEKRSLGFIAELESTLVVTFITQVERTRPTLRAQVDFKCLRIILLLPFPALSVEV